MKIPIVPEPERYRGLYVFDFGEWCALGYTAEEIALLLESERFQSGKVYRIHRASPDGHMEIRGISAEHFNAESGMFFERRERDAAEGDFEQLCRFAQDTPPPCRAVVQLAERCGSDDRPHVVTALIYPAEHDDDVAQWLLRVNYEGGDTVEGGVSHVTNYRCEDLKILRRQQLWSAASASSRSRAEVYASVRRAVQR